MSRVNEILSFWFGEPQDSEAYYKERLSVWFTPKPHFDQEIKDRFGTDYQLAAERKLADWQETPRGSLALVLLLDQFPRNMFRGDRQAFATDPLAQEVAEHTIQNKFDLELLAIECLFVYLPFMHSENLAAQHRSVALFQKLAQECCYLEDALSPAIKHKEIIERFGRYPHRNAILGRASTPEEVEFLQQSGSSS
jgi:uncharacterized protein (DUF924 family)